MTKTFSHLERQKFITQAVQNPEQQYDLVIVGGGITGAGVARDATSRGLSVFLVEAQDFAFGTSSRSSKLIHGGLRYLENLEFGLVFEALNERQKLYEMAPHLVHPMRFVLPIFTGSRVSMLKLGCGMWLYDALALFAAEAHERLNVDDTLARVPGLRGHDLRGSYVYSDAYMDDDRLVIETLRSAARMGARCLNYVRAGRATTNEQGKLSALECRDQLTGQTFTVRGQHFVSTVGPWTDLWGASLFSDWQKMLKPSKGIHLTLPKSRLPLKDCVVMADDEKQRIVFGIPRHDMVIIGTTDTPYSGDPAEVGAKVEDVRYLNGLANEFFPGANLQPKDYIASYAGVRPLVDSGEASVGKTSREHTVHVDPRGCTFVAGGKYTTYRQMAQDIVARVLEELPQDVRLRTKPSATDTVINPATSYDSLLRARGYTARWTQESQLPLATIAALVERHGLETEALLTASARAYWQLEAQHAIENTMCLKLLDFYVRRSPLFLAHADHGQQWLSSIAQVFTDAYGWSQSRLAQEQKAVEDYRRQQLAWQAVTF